MINKQLDFFKSIEDNNINKVKELLLHKRVNPAIHNNKAILEASEYGYFNLVKLLLIDPRTNPSEKKNGMYPISAASSNGHFEVVELLLSDNRVDPTVKYNFAIHFANIYKFSNIVDLLWNNQKVKNTLKNDDLILYYELINKDIIKKKITGI